MKALVVAAGIIRSDDKLLICKRPDDKSLEGGKWEFPGGKAEDNETPEQALKRELKEELDIEVEVGKIYDARIKKYGETYILVMFYLCGIIKGVPKAIEHSAISFVTEAELLNYDLADADRRVAERIISDKEKTDA